MAELQGGKFGSGFASAGLSKALSPVIAGATHPVEGVLLSAVVGGTVSELTGGKFANGALTSAMGYAFNSLSEARSRAYARFEEKIRAAFSGDFAPGARGATYHTEEAAAFMWATLAQPITNEFARWRFEVGATIFGDGEFFTWGTPDIGTEKGGWVAISGNRGGAGGRATAMIHTHPSPTSFSGQSLMWSADRFSVVRSIGGAQLDSDLGTAARVGRNSYVSGSNMRLDKWDYGAYSRRDLTQDVMLNRYVTNIRSGH